MKSAFAMFLACLTLLAADLARAGSVIDLQVVSRATGLRMPVYQHRGRAYVVGTPGERYSIQLRNLTGARVMGVLSIDGVNAITGETASPNQTGYVLDPYQVAEIAGWRKTSDEVARFYFTPLPDSYAARTDRPDNVGVIGLAVFREYVEPVAVYAPKAQLSANQAARDAAAPGPAEPASPAGSGSVMREKRAEERLGTGHGEREYSSITSTDFRRATTTPAEMVAVWYDARERLVAMGVIRQPVPYSGTPRPFPGQFVPDPRS